MHVTLSEGPLPSIVCPDVVPWGMEILNLPLTLAN